MITAREQFIGKGVTFGNVDIEVNGTFKIGDYSHLGDCVIRGNNVEFGDHLYVSGGLKIGGGGADGPNANLIVGDRCTFHDNFINVCELVVIGDDVGFSHRVSIITHGFWQNAFEGYPTKFEPVYVNNNVIVGYGATILPGTFINSNTVIGAQSVVRGVIGPGVWAGNPAKFIRDIVGLSSEAKLAMFKDLADRYNKLLEFKGRTPDIQFSYPEIFLPNFRVNVLNCNWEGEEDGDSDHLRDFLRKFGVRVYTKRPFG